MEIIINETRIKFEENKIWKFGKQSWNSQETWFVLKGSIQTNQNGYKLHRTKINGKLYTTARIIYKLHNPEWDINDNSKNNTIDHININSLDNKIENLRVASMLEQTLNRGFVLNAKGYYFHKSSQKWQAQISIDNKVKFLGYFVLEIDAHNAYLSAVQERNII